MGQDGIDISYSRKTNMASRSKVSAGRHEVSRTCLRMTYLLTYRGYRPSKQEVPSTLSFGEDGIRLNHANMIGYSTNTEGELWNV